MLGSECVILGHHYQRDEVVRFADYRGDSYRLSQTGRAGHRAATSSSAACTSWRRAPTFWRAPDQPVILPDLNAGCSMADMAEISQVEDCLGAVREPRPDRRRGQRHHAHHLHELDGGHQGVLRRARRAGLHLIQRRKAHSNGHLAATQKIFFLPDQHLGRNTGYALGIPLDEMVVWDPYHAAGRPDGRAAAQGAR